MGDSGGPLVCDSASQFLYHDGKKLKDQYGQSQKLDQYGLIGIVSFGTSEGGVYRGCAHDKNAGVYTRTSAYVDWIKRYVPNAQYV